MPGYIRQEPVLQPLLLFDGKELLCRLNEEQLVPGQQFLQTGQLLEAAGVPARRVLLDGAPLSSRSPNWP
mgnify:CR=1 FL=1